MFYNRQRLLSNKEQTWYLDQCEIKDPDELFEHCIGLAWLIKPPFEGTNYSANRNIGVYSDTAPGYHISKRSNTFVNARPLTEPLKLLLQQTNLFFDEDYNLIVVNEYLNNKDSIGPHFDDFSGIGKHGVVTISLGAERIFQITSQESKTVPPKSFNMPHGNVMVMSRVFQQIYNHSVPSSDIPSGKRISLTFRSIYGIIHHRPKVWRPYDPIKCIVCGGNTYHKHKVCDTCFPLNKFKCPKCGVPVGADNWPCTECYLAIKKQKLTFNVENVSK